MKKQTEQDQTVRDFIYQPGNFFMLRTPALPSTTFTLLSTINVDMVGDMGSSSLHFYHMLFELADNHPLIQQALAVASPALLERLITTRQNPDSRSTKRACSRLLRYIIRMSTRPTPFGLFAGMAIGTFADKTDLGLSTPSFGKIRARPDMGWLMSLLQRTEQSLEFVEQLRVKVNQEVYIIGHKGFLPNADVYGQKDRRFITFKCTPIIRYILEMAKQPTLYTELVSASLALFPEKSSQEMQNIVWQLWNDHILISDLRPPMTCTSPVGYLFEQLDNYQGVESVKQALSTALDKSAKVDQVGIGGSVALIYELAHYLDQAVPPQKEIHPQFQVDAKLQLKGTRLNNSVGKTAAQAAETLLRLTVQPQGLPHLHEYRWAFIEKYGDEVEVPLLDLLNPEKGMDAPNGYKCPSRTYHLNVPIRPLDMSKRDKILCTLVAEVINDKRMEIELTEELIQQIETWHPNKATAPSSLEIHLQLQATSHEALDQGKWTAIISPTYGSSASGCSFGRFFDLLEVEDMNKMGQFFHLEEQLYPDALVAELCYQPWYARAMNIALRPPLCAYQICINTTPSVPPDHVITADDLVVGVRNNRFYVRSKRLGKTIIVRQTHMLVSSLASNVCRFLAEIAQDGQPILLPFDWGAAAVSPFLPRLFQGKIVLSPAQWNVQREDIVPIDAEDEEYTWSIGLKQWRSLWRVPRYIFVAEGDERLLLDLDHPLISIELREILQRAGSKRKITLTEVIPDLEHLWLKDTQNQPYFSEVVIPLLRQNANIQFPEQSQSSSCYSLYPISQYARSMFPGDAWTQINLYTSFRLQSEILIGPLQSLLQRLSTLEVIDGWFYIRYDDPEPHLRLRFRSPERQMSIIVIEEVLQWCRSVVEQSLASHFSLDTYQREVERYGGPEAIDLLEQVFCVDSVITTSIITHQNADTFTLDPLSIAVFTLNTICTYWGMTLQERLRWITNRTARYRQYEKAEIFHQKRQLLCELLEPWDHTSHLLLHEQRDKLLELLSPFQEILPKASTHVQALEKSQQLWVYIDQLIDSLLHMHLNRLLEVGITQEKDVYLFWKYTLESVAKRSLMRQKGLE